MLLNEYRSCCWRVSRAVEKGEESGVVVVACPMAMSNTAKMVKLGIVEERILESNYGACVVSLLALTHTH